MTTNDPHRTTGERVSAFIGLIIAGVIIVIVGALAGCSSAPVKTPPVVAQCATECYAPCTPSEADTGVEWTSPADSSSAWDSLAGDVVPDLVQRLQVCETRRKACVQCLDRLKNNGVIQ